MVLTCHRWKYLPPIQNPLFVLIPVITSSVILNDKDMMIPHIFILNCPG